jgi:hypothetical protein
MWSGVVFRAVEESSEFLFRTPTFQKIKFIERFGRVRCTECFILLTGIRVLLSANRACIPKTILCLLKNLLQIQAGKIFCTELNRMSQSLILSRALSYTCAKDHLRLGRDEQKRVCKKKSGIWNFSFAWIHRTQCPFLLFQLEWLSIIFSLQYYIIIDFAAFHLLLIVVFTQFAIAAASFY